MLTFIIHTKNGLSIACKSGDDVKIIPGEDAINATNLAIDYNFRRDMYAVKMTQPEIDYFKIHHYIWQTFLNSGESVCLIQEDGVDFSADEDDMAEVVTELGDDWDVFFLFDKTESHYQHTSIELQTSRFGIFWGDYAYMLHREGATKLVDINCIRQSADEEILAASADGKLEAVYYETDWVTCDEKTLYSYRIRHQAALSAVMAYSGWSDHNRTLAQKLMRMVRDHAAKLRIDLVLHGGTLLGHVRHDAIMPWDDDIDLGIDEHVLQPLLQSIEAEGVIQFKQLPWTYEGADSIYYKLWLDEGEEIPGHDYKFPFVDIWLYFDDGVDIYYKEAPRFRYPRETYLPFQSVSFEGTTMQIPHDAIGALDLMFNTWKKQIVVYPWSHRQEKQAFRFMRVPIQVSDNGRLQSLIRRK